MSQTHSLHDASGVILTLDNGDIILAAGTSVPTGAGYSPGCHFIVRSGASAGAELYKNEGSATSADFNKVPSIDVAQTFAAANTFSGANIFSGANTHSGAETFDDLIETDYNPYTRVWVRTDFTNTVGKASLLSGSYAYSNISLNPDWVVSGSGAGAVLGFTGEANSAGAAYLNNSSASSAFVFMKPSKTGKVSKVHWSTSKAARFRALIKTGAAITANKIVMGLYSGSVRPARFINGTNTKNRVGVYLDEVADSNWRAEAAMSTTASSSASAGIVVAADTIYDIEIRLSTARIATVYINSALVATFETALKANKRLVPIIGVQTEDAAGTTAANQGVNVFHTLLSQDITAT